ncbi:MAG TPA: hypothetical protein ENG03_01845 [Thioploca sp.]|nr:MAG: hypothetical protein B6247_04380 [Beggiatoa sp. 4572_84]RKZ61029.1 MAG: hypothetical protein DRR08_09785 [Gammaproteobacteria bacterium]HDN25842.1 hypothetical protein [Thioploca sp.]
MNIGLKTNYLIIFAASALILSSCATPPPEPSEPKPKKPAQAPKPEYIQVALRDAQMIGQKIWMNEGSAKVENLTVWNKGEEFASLGIGHFIWYPAGKQGRYTETFPQLITFLQKQGVQVPAWLQNTPDAPWNSHEAFKYYEQSPQMVELRTLLVNTIPQQVQFIIQRLEQALPTMLESLPTERQRNHVFKQFYRVATTAPNGVYALVDYVNFKGEGTKPKERYRGQGWGLLQVLENMQGNSADVMGEFAQAAEFVLRRRIQNSPPERNESRWFQGWKNRIKTYTY